MFEHARSRTLYLHTHTQRHKHANTHILCSSSNRHIRNGFFLLSKNCVYNRVRNTKRQKEGRNQTHTHTHTKKESKHTSSTFQNIRKEYRNKIYRENCRIFVLVAVVVIMWCKHWNRRLVLFLQYFHSIFDSFVSFFFIRLLYCSSVFRSFRFFLKSVYLLFSFHSVRFNLLSFRKFVKIKTNVFFFLAANAMEDDKTKQDTIQWIL